MPVTFTEIDTENRDIAMLVPQRWFVEAEAEAFCNHCYHLQAELTRQSCVSA